MPLTTKLPTVKIKGPPGSEMPYVIINASEFDARQHKRHTEEPVARDVLLESTVPDEAPVKPSKARRRDP